MYVCVTVNLILNVGFIINEGKSVLVPITKLQYWGNFIDSEAMVVTLPRERRDKIIQQCQNLFYRKKL